MTASTLLSTCARSVASIALLAVTLAGCATQSVAPAALEKLVADAQATLDNFIRDPDQTWIQENLGRATNIPWNDAYYGRSNVLPSDILIRRSVSSPKASPLLAEVAKATR